MGLLHTGRKLVKRQVCIIWENSLYSHIHLLSRGCHGCDRMVVGFTTTYAISAYHHWCCELESRSGRGVQHYVIKFVSDLRQVGGFLRVLRFPPPISKTDSHDRIEILLKVALTLLMPRRLMCRPRVECQYDIYMCRLGVECQGDIYVV
jgi:hypothetical protein